MGQTELEIFRLCEKLAELLGDSEAVADLKRLYEHYPEMFENMRDVAQTISEVVKTPDLIADAKRAGAILAAKKLSNEKMGEVVVANDNGTNVIFHANKKRIKEFEKLRSSLVETPTPPTHRSKSAGELMDKNPSGANAHSANSLETIPQAQSKNDQVNELKEKIKAFAKSLKSKLNGNEMER